MCYKLIIPHVLARKIKRINIKNSCNLNDFADKKKEIIIIIHKTFIFSCLRYLQNSEYPIFGINKFN